MFPGAGSAVVWGAHCTGDVPHPARAALPFRCEVLLLRDIAAQRGHLTGPPSTRAGHLAWGGGVALVAGAIVVKLDCTFSPKAAGGDARKGEEGG